MDIEDVHDNFSEYTASELLAIYNYIGFQIDDLKEQWENLSLVQTEVLAIVHGIEDLEADD